MPPFWVTADFKFEAPDWLWRRLRKDGDWLAVGVVTADWFCGLFMLRCAILSATDCGGGGKEWGGGRMF